MQRNLLRTRRCRPHQLRAYRNPFYRGNAVVAEQSPIRCDLDTMQRDHLAYICKGIIQCRVFTYGIRGVNTP